MKSSALLLLICCVVLSVPVGTAPSGTAVAQTIDFETQVAPILAEHCVRCHSPGNAKGDVSLATIADLLENEYVIAGDADASHLVALIESVDGDAEMPKEADPLGDAQVALVRQWIEQGALWPDGIIVRQRSKADSSWWSLQPIETPPGSIDDFIRAKLAEQNLQLNPPADRRALIRRVTYDLTGLPPTPEEVAAFVDDPRSDAYERLIDRLLASPHYGERWGRHWLDVVRFGESNGFERNVIINNLWPFRDYVIRSINEDKPFDQFIREHIAGDVGKVDPDVAVATAFLVAGPYDDVGNQDAAQAAQIRANTLDEIIGATGQAFLGLTVGCARCHDHKFDPITQRDYYSMYATFAGVRHGAVPLATEEAARTRDEQLRPLNQRKADLDKERKSLTDAILKRGVEKLDDYRAAWTRSAVDRTGTEERFEPVTAKFVRFVCDAQDNNPATRRGFRIDEFEIWSTEDKPRNVALQSHGAKATGASRRIEDFPGAYGPQLTIDGKTGARFIAAGFDLTIELPEPTEFDRIVFSSAKGESTPAQNKFVFVSEYHIEVSDDGETWKEITSGRDRKPIGLGPESEANQSPQLRHRLLDLETTAEDKRQQAKINKDLAAVNREIAKVPAVPSVWIGKRVQADAKGPFHVFLGGNPQKKGDSISPNSLSALADVAPQYQLESGVAESERRAALADWITDRDNPLTPRVLANRLWHYHFGKGIVDTPSDFGYMGGRPTHPELLDFLASKLLENGWRIKALHRLIMTSDTYQQSSAYRADAAAADADARLLWRFPPRRLAAEEIRDTILAVTGKLTIDHEAESVADGGPGFRLYHFMQDNVCTYVPLDEHGPETYRRAVYHQNARASVTDLMTDFDQPDCAFTAPRRAETTTPLQALTMLNHSFTLKMAEALASRLGDEDRTAAINRAFELCYGRSPEPDELASCRSLIDEHGMVAFCRAMLNTSEMIYVR